MTDWVWDTLMSAVPLTTTVAHENKIYGIGWHGDDGRVSWIYSGDFLYLFFHTFLEVSILEERFRDAIWRGEVLQGEK